MLAELDSFLRLLVVGGGLLALLLLLRLARTAHGRLPARPQTVVGLTPAHALHVVEVDGRRLLVGTGPSGPPQLLLELPELPVTAALPPWAAETRRERWRADGP